jgi:hypothetical protein
MQHHIAEAEKRQREEAARKAAREEREKSATEDSRKTHEMRLAAARKQYGDN